MRYTHPAEGTFGPRLKAHRERRGITLEGLEECTKIKASLFAELEENNLAHWPEGIYRRAWLRAYLTAIGMPPEPLLEEVARLFPKPLAKSGAERADPPPLRLTLADTGGRTGVTRSRVMDTLSNLVVVLAFGGMLVAVSDLSFWTASGTVALIWYPVASAIFGGVSPQGLLRSWSVQSQNPSAPPHFAAPLRGVAGAWWLRVLRCRMRSAVSEFRVGRPWRFSRPAANPTARTTTIEPTAAAHRHPMTRRFSRMSDALGSLRLAGSVPLRNGERGLKLLPAPIREKRSARRHRRHKAAQRSVDAK